MKKVHSFEILPLIMFDISSTIAADVAEKNEAGGDQLALMKECPLILKLTDDNPPAYPTHQRESFFNVALRCTFIIRVKNWELDATIVLCKQDPLVHDSVYLHAHNQRIVNVRPSIVCNKKEQRLYFHFDLYI